LNAPAADRAAIDALVADLVSALGAAGMYTVLHAIAAATDDTMAAVLHGLTDRVPVAGRQIYLRTATPWVARALEAWAAGDFAEALRWRDRAASELERFRNEPRGDTQ
jgi:hypothetical protein